MAVYRAVLTKAQEARPSLIDLWSRNLPAGSRLDDKFRWFYLDSPAGPANAFLLQAQDGPDAGRDVGCAGIGNREFSYRGRILKAALLADLAVDKSHRTVLPAITLQRGVRSHTREAFDLSYGFPNKHAVAIHTRIGFHLLGHMERWVLVLRHGRYLRRVIKMPLLPSIAGRLVDAARRFERAPRVMQARVSSRLEMLTQVDERFDQLWERARDRYPITGHRSAAFLRWRFLDKPAERSRVAALTRRLGGEILAYAVVCQRDHTASLADVFGDSEEHVDQLLDLLTGRLRREGFSAMSMRFLGMPSLGERLAARGFQMRERSTAVIVDAGAAVPIAPELLRDPTNWYLTDGDEDT